ncbi:hypothetical protein ABZ820_40910 [Streptomyces diacarni]|uniref:hypothetical protein n=1 Tax=Streptomyces diacarni TaxID=2800381 RepID=UPI0033C47D13
MRTHVRIRAAAQGLVNGESVDAIAQTVCYRETSAFINAFRRATGQTRAPTATPIPHHHPHLDPSRA